MKSYNEQHAGSNPDHPHLQGLSTGAPQPRGQRGAVKADTRPDGVSYERDSFEDDPNNDFGDAASNFNKDDCLGMGDMGGTSDRSSASHRRACRPERSSSSVSRFSCPATPWWYTRASVT